VRESGAASQGGIGLFHARDFFARISAARAFTIFFTSPTGIGLSNGNRIVPFDVSYFFSSAAFARLTSPING
jgi:hypothetical protein